MKKTLIIIGCMVLYLSGIIGGALFGYDVGYDDAMKDVETKVMEGVEQLNDMLKLN